MTTTVRRSTRSTDPVELLLAGKTPAFGREAWYAAVSLYYFDRDQGELPPEIQAHLRSVLDKWRPEYLVAGW
jgi:hypothetical protein